METPKESNQQLVPRDSQISQLGLTCLTTKGFLEGSAKLRTVYTTLTEGFYQVLGERLKFYKFSDVEFQKTINHIIDTNKYPPQVSDFISYMRPEGVADIPKEEKPYESIPDPVKEKEIADFNAKLLAEE